MRALIFVPAIAATVAACAEADPAAELAAACADTHSLADIEAIDGWDLIDAPITPDQIIERYVWRFGEAARTPEGLAALADLRNVAERRAPERLWTVLVAYRTQGRAQEAACEYVSAAPLAFEPERDAFDLTRIGPI